MQTQDKGFCSTSAFTACGIGMDAYKEVSLLTIGNLGSLKKLNELIAFSSVGHLNG